MNRKKMTSIQNAFLFLTFNPDQRYQEGGSEFWLEPAEPFANDRVRARRGDVSRKKLMREKRRNDPRVYNHWKLLI